MSGRKTATRPAVFTAIMAILLGLVIGCMATPTTDDRASNGTAERVTERDTAEHVTITRTAPDVIGHDPAPWQAGWTAERDASGSEADVTVRPCVREDGPDPCYWDASERGNGTGRSFITDVHGTVTYLDTIAPCTREESAGRNDPCYWNASERGNGQGRSFITDSAGNVTRLG